MSIAIMAALAILFMGGVWLSVVWGGRSIKPPADQGPHPSKQAARAARVRRFLWWSDVVCVAAVLSGLLVAWPGARLAMRILAATSPDSVQGRITEAHEIVGAITLDGTVALLFFGGFPSAFVSAAIYVLIHRWLPAGRLAGPLAGLWSLVVFGAWIDPLRANNIDFRLIRPGWLAVLLFTLLAALLGATVAAVAGWISQRLPLPSRRTASAYLPLLGSLLFPPVTILILLGTLVALIWPADAPERPRKARAPRMLWAGRAVIALPMILALPVFIPAVVSILSA